MRNSLPRIVLGLIAIGGLAALWVIPSYAQMPGTMAQPAMSPARVWINNQKREDAIPVNIVNTDPRSLPIPVNGQVEVTTVRQAWDYRDVTFTPTQAIAAGLGALGGDGWEAIGMTTQPNGSVTVLLKRPRP